MKNIGFEPTRTDHCVFKREEGIDMSYILIYVDDILISTNSITTRETIKREISNEVNIKDLGAVEHFLGMVINRSEQGTHFTFSQHH